MHRTYVITDLHIPYDILQDKRFTLEEKFLMAIEKQYPKILREDIASIMNITVRQVSNHRKSINKKLKEEINFPKKEENFPKREINFPQTPKTNTDTDVSVKDTVEHRNNVNKVLKFIKTLTSQETYNEKRKRILEIYTHKEMFTDDDFALFDEKIDEMRSKFEEM